MKILQRLPEKLFWMLAAYAEGVSFSPDAARNAAASV